MASTELDLHAARVVTDAAERLRAAGSPTPRLDAEVLVSHAFGRDRAWLHAHPEAVLDVDVAAELASWVDRRAEGEPIAYIRGFKDWFSLRLATDARALIPRPETELLAESAIAEIAARLARDTEPITVWDVGTGSGALILALGLRFKTAVALARVRLIASDASADALELAAENLRAHGVAGAVALACSSLLESAGGWLPAPDVIVTNLPYVPSDEVTSRAGSLRYEPVAALDGGPDGLDAVHALLAQLPARLAPGGVALLEIGAGQAEAVRALAEELPMRCAISSFPDLAGIDRVVRIARI
ncbi:MAG TPA: peptide chain release factor N(5)-glutamine methyltransferase [Candidatus Limnocylindria bacterium]|nr:peptide chain release factor N(5)-glutamine methyltransferase [Candidatus Limnocylindria bacterium]